MCQGNLGHIIEERDTVFPVTTLLQYSKTFEHSKIIASHDLDLIMDVCHRCIVIKEGTVVADGPVSEILTNKKLLEENHLELPLSLQRR